MKNIEFDCDLIQGVCLGFELDDWHNQFDTEYYFHIDLLLFRVTITLTVED